MHTFNIPSNYFGDQFDSRAFVAPVARKSSWSHYAQAVAARKQLFQEKVTIARTIPVVISSREALESSTVFVIEAAVPSYLKFRTPLNVFP